MLGIGVRLGFRIVDIARHTEATIKEATGKHGAPFRRPLLGDRVHLLIDRELEEWLLEIKTGTCLDMHRAGEATFRHGGGRPLDHVNTFDHIRRQFAQIGAAAAIGAAGALGQPAIGIERAHAVDINQGRIRPLATKREALTFAVIAAIQRNTGDAGDGFVDVFVGEVADIFGNDRIGRRLGALLAIDRRALRGALTGNDDECGIRCLGQGLRGGLGCCLGCRLCRSNAGAGKQCNQRKRRSIPQTTILMGFLYHLVFLLRGFSPPDLILCNRDLRHDLRRTVMKA